MKRVVCIAVLTLSVGAYLSVPILLFDCSESVVVLGKPKIDRLAVLDKESRAYCKTVLENPEDEEARRKLGEIRDAWDAIEAGGTRGYRVRRQEAFLQKYQAPHVLRHIFPWFNRMGRIFPVDTVEYLLWLWFTLICINIASCVHTRVLARWKADPRIVACSRWVFFCLGAMGASMILIVLLNYGVAFSFIGVASRVLSGPAHVFEQRVGGISWVWEEKMILYSAIQWTAIGTLGCALIAWMKGKHLVRIIVVTLAACTILGFALADAAG